MSELMHATITELLGLLDDPCLDHELRFEAEALLAALAEGGDKEGEGQ